VAFADRHADVAQDAVGGRNVEEEIRQDEIEEIDLSLQLLIVTGDVKRNVPGFGSINGGRRHTTHVLERLVDPPAEIGKALLVVGIPRWLESAEASRSAFGKI